MLQQEHSLKPGRFVHYYFDSSGPLSVLSAKLTANTVIVMMESVSVWRY